MGCLSWKGLLLAQAFLCLAAATWPSAAQTGQSPLESAYGGIAPPADAGDGVVSYSAAFFRRYQANTALDMVNRIPGFILDNGGDKRGFGGAAGNVLINDRRPSTKQDLPSAILARISADMVQRIELIRVRVRDIDLQGHTEVANVILDGEAPAAWRWEAYVRENFDLGTTPFAAVSLADRLGEIEYNVGVDYRKTTYGDPGVISRYDGGGALLLVRDDADRASGFDVNGYLNASTWLGDNFVQVNSRLGYMPRDIVITSTLYPQVAGEDSGQIIFDSDRDITVVELGADGERVLGENLLGKAIMLYSYHGLDPSSSRLDIDVSGLQTRFQQELEETRETEVIARLELDWAGFEDHAVQLDMERALNILENELVFTDDAGAGPVVIDVPGGNVRVEEVRWNYLVQDTWSLGRFDLEYGLALERSTISQSGDAVQQRDFSFLKPRTVLTYTPVRGRQTRLRLEREVSQLDFNDFVTATVFEDNNVTLGNPDLRPDTTWIAELSHERRFGTVGVVKLTAFHHWISDVLDLLPLAATVEAPGNIGDGRRHGLILETTLPLDFTGLTGARLDVKLRWQDSRVTDPVTGGERVLSAAGGYRNDVLFLDENRYAFDIDYRQDLESARVSWGMGLAERARRPLFKANELDIFNEGYDLTAFIETTRWFGLNMGIQGQNLLNAVQRRDRTIYTGARSLSPVLRRELRDGDNGARLIFRISGTF